MADIRLLPSLSTIDRYAWNDCFPGELENYEYLMAIETSGMPDFSWGYLTVWENTLLVAAISAFFTDYALDTTLEGSARKIASSLRHLAPGALTLKLACLGSPDTEYGLVGFHPVIEEADKPALLLAMLREFEAQVVTQHYRFIGLKDVPAFQQPLWSQALRTMHFRTVGGLPVARLSIDFPDIDTYLARLSAGTRKDMRRKLRAADSVRVEFRREVEDVLPQIMQLYHQTRARADMQFEELTPAFFRQVLQLHAGAVCALYFVGEELLAANLLLHNETTLLDKFFCMDEARGREYHLYFLSWFTNLGYCLEHGLTQYQSGQAAYENKIRLGSQLVGTSMYFKHKNSLIHGVLSLAAPFLADVSWKEAA